MIPRLLVHSDSRVSLRWRFRTTDFDASWLIRIPLEDLMEIRKLLSGKSPRHWRGCQRIENPALLESRVVD
jgi:hypothetical protein